MNSLEPSLQKFFRAAKQISVTSSEDARVAAGINAHFSVSLVRDTQDLCQTGHMTHPSHSFSSGGKNIAMTAEENSRLQKAIFSYVSSKPVRVKDALHHKGQFSLETLRENIVSFLSPLRPMPIIAAIAALFVSLGGISYAAESTVPGDLLYPVKIHVNENVSAAFHVSEESKADFYSDRAEERVEEAQALMAEGRLNAEAREELAHDLSVSLAQAQENIAKLSAKGNTQAALALSSRLEGQLEGYTLLLKTLNVDLDGQAETSAETAAFLKLLEEKHKDAVDARTKAEVNVSASTDADLESGARARVTAVKKSLNSMKAGADAAADAQLKVANDLLLKAEADLHAGTYQKALLTAENAERHAQKAQIFSSVAGGLHLGAKNQSSSSVTSSAQNSSVSSTSSAQSSVSSSSTQSSASSVNSSSADDNDNRGHGSVKIKDDVKVKVDSDVKIKTGL
jgi:hypothetical protein